MSEQPRVGDRKPQKGDLIRVSYEATVDDVMDDGRVYVADASGAAWVAFVPPPATVEVVERANEPDDPWGTVRTEAPDGLLWVKCANGDWTCLSVCVDDEDDDYVSAFPITGAVPGTPAAEANPVPPQVLARVKEMLSNGQKIRAIKALREACVGLGLKEAKVYAESLPEWAEGDRVLADQVRDGLDPHKPVVLKQADTGDGFEPKVWHSDEEEPPARVKALEWLENPEASLRFLIRADAPPWGWLWSEHPDADPVDMRPAAWPPLPGRYREVQPK